MPGIANDIKKPGVEEHGYTKSSSTSSPRCPASPTTSRSPASRSTATPRPRCAPPTRCSRPTRCCAPTSARSSARSCSSARPRTTSSTPPAPGPSGLRWAPRDVREELLENSYHVATLDNDAQQIFEGSLAFVERVAGVTAGELTAVTTPSHDPDDDATGGAHDDLSGGVSADDAAWRSIVDNYGDRPSSARTRRSTARRSRPRRGGELPRRARGAAGTTRAGGPLRAAATAPAAPARTAAAAGLDRAVRGPDLRAGRARGRARPAVVAGSDTHGLVRRRVRLPGRLDAARRPATTTTTGRCCSRRCRHEHRRAARDAQRDRRDPGSPDRHGALSKVLNDITEYGGDYVGRAVRHRARLRRPVVRPDRVSADDEDTLQRILMRLQIHGVNQVDPGEAEVCVAEHDGVFPDGFYSSTNLETQVRLDGHWVAVQNPEMDCGLIVDGRGRRPRRPHAADGRRRGRACRSSAAPPASRWPCPVGGEGRGLVRLHGVRRLQREAPGGAGAPGRRRHARGQGGRQEGALGRRSRGRAHRRRAGDGRAGRGGVRRRAVRRQRPGHPRHRVGALRHLARHRPGPRPGRRARPRAPHPRDQHDPQGRVDPGRRRAGRADQRDHARAGHPRQGVRAGRLGARRRPAARRLHRRHRGPARDARQARGRRASA